MSFRLKLVALNIILLAAAFSVCGFLFISKNSQTAFSDQLSAGINENQMVTTMFESEIINLVLKDEYSGPQDIPQAAKGINDSFKGTQPHFNVLDENLSVIYSNFEGTDVSFSALTGNLMPDKKNYVALRGPEDTYFLAVAGTCTINDTSFYIATFKDISSIYIRQHEQLRFFRIIMLVFLFISSIIATFIAHFLTRPISRLNRITDRIASGDYSMRARVHSSDEIGRLADKFNLMAESVEDNINKIMEESRKKDEFVAAFTHELKTPLTSVIGYADMLRSGNLSEKDRLTAANYIFHEGVRLERLSMNLFDMLLADDAPLSMQPISLTSLISAVESSAAPRLQAEGINFKTQAERVYISGEAELIKTVIINLVDNARKASSPGSTIHLEAYRAGDRAVIDVIDQGSGIPKEKIAKVTEPFYMVDKSRARQSGGAGLGLAISARIIKRHNGSLQIESELGQGTLVRLSFPVVEGKK